MIAIPTPRGVTPVHSSRPSSDSRSFRATTKIPPPTLHSGRVAAGAIPNSVASTPTIWAAAAATSTPRQGANGGQRPGQARPVVQPPGARAAEQGGREHPESVGLELGLNQQQGAEHDATKHAQADLSQQRGLLGILSTLAHASKSGTM